QIMPRIWAWVSGDREAYLFLPESVLDFPQREGFLSRLAAAGFERGRYESLSLGILCLYLARRSQ
ncbi:MAG TPA: class I SAM-dependent methyltransferase, partial [Thermoanaerobaculia bacterium]|nr:class I SAM-dependent methyltransferase [Thermoanaerobaculia bacterium]